MSIKTAISDRIKFLKDEKGLSWEKLAYSAGLAKSSMTWIKNGKYDVKISTLCKIALALDITVSELLNFEIDLNDID